MRPVELLGKQRPQTAPDNGVVVDDEDSHRRGVSHSFDRRRRDRSLAGRILLSDHDPRARRRSDR